MNREILFRGIGVVDKDKPVYPRFYHGSLVHNAINGKYFIMGDKTHAGNGFPEVNPQTVGQYTGLKDKNGKKIFEGDIISGCTETHGCAYCRFVPYYDNEYCVMTQVVWENTGFHLKDWGELVGNSCINDLRVIGNIHNNQELLEG